MSAETSIILWQQSCPLLGTSYCKTKAFPYCIPAHTQSVLSAWSCCALHPVSPEFPEHSENTELKMTWVCAMNVMAGIFIGNHDSRAGEPVFVKTCSCFPAWDTLDEVCCLALPRAVLALLGSVARASKRKWLSCLWQHCLFQQITRAIAELKFELQSAQT